MAWNKNYNNGGGYNNHTYRNFNEGYQRPKKRSGARFKIIEKAPIISAWRVSRGQLFSLYARPYKGTKIITSKNGVEWINLFVTITNKSTMQITNTSGLYDHSRKRLYLKDYNQIVTDRGNGGYWGNHIRKNYKN